MVKRYCSLVIVSVLFGAALRGMPAHAQAPANGVRIAILKDVDSVQVGVRGRYEILDGDGRKTLASGRNLRVSRVKPLGPSLAVGDASYLTGRLRFQSDKDVTVVVRGKERRYRGVIDVLRKGDTLVVINIIDLEDYIRGVLYHEVSHRWPLEAIKAQAVATRTYAVYQMQNQTKQDFDVTSDIYSQVYGGRTSEQYRTNVAVDRTRGEILVYDGKVLPAYFHATCAGHTEDVSEIWKQKMPPLQGGPCPYCRHSPHYRWKKNFRSKLIQDILNKDGRKIGLIKDVSVQERNESGRIRTLVITDRDGKTLKISGKDFRQLVGPNVIRSNMYDVIMKGYYFDLVGKGWGHGVGLCQWGADGMARAHRDYEEILSFYYPGSTLTDYSAWARSSGRPR